MISGIYGPPRAGRGRPEWRTSDEIELAPISPEAPCGPDLDAEGDLEFMNFLAAVEGQLPSSYFSFDRKTIDFPAAFAARRRAEEEARRICASSCSSPSSPFSIAIFTASRARWRRSRGCSPTAGRRFIPQRRQATTTSRGSRNSGRSRMPPSSSAVAIRHVVANRARGPAGLSRGHGRRRAKPSCARARNSPPPASSNAC